MLVVPTPPEIRDAYGYPPSLRACRWMREWDAWLEGFAPMVPDPAEPPGTIIYTSGTTGRPKGVRRSPPTPEQTAIQRAILSASALATSDSRRHRHRGDRADVPLGAQRLWLWPRGSAST